MTKQQPFASEAVRDLDEFLSLAKREAGAAEILKNCFELGLPVIVGDNYIDAATGAWDGVVRLKLNEAMMTYLSAFRARNGEHVCC